jgi:hypothetical protein
MESEASVSTDLPLRAAGRTAREVRLNTYCLAGELDVVEEDGLEVAEPLALPVVADDPELFSEFMASKTDIPCGPIVMTTGSPLLLLA